MDRLLSDKRAPKAISLTALIDVVFILLMFFMLTSSFTQWRAISLQSASAASSHQNTKQPALIVVHSNGSLSLNDLDGEALTASQLREQIDREQSAVLIPMAATEVQTLIRTMETLKTAGFKPLTLGNSLPQQSTGVGKP